MKLTGKTIYFLLPDLGSGGAERVSVTIARILKKEGYDVKFLNLGEEKGEIIEWIVPEFELISLGFSRSLKAIFSLIKFMKSHNDALFFSSREHVNLISLIASHFAKTNAIVRIPNMPKNKLTRGYSGLKMRIIKNLNKYAFKRAKTIIAQNKEMALQLKNFYNLKDDKIIVINNPVDKEYIINQSNELNDPFDHKYTNFLSVCNIAYSKGIDVLLDAWPIVKEKIPNAKLYIMGKDTTDLAQGLKQKYSGDADIIFTGFKNNPYPYIKNCDTFVLSSRMEGFPNVVLEAMCFNRPIASTNCVSILEEIIKPGENGFICNINDPIGLANTMIKACNLQNIETNYNLFDKNKLIQCFK